MKCEQCSKEHNGSYGSGRFCSKECARAFSTASKRAMINAKVSQRMKQIAETTEGFGFKNPEQHQKASSKAVLVNQRKWNEYRQDILTRPYEELKYQQLRSRIIFEQNGCCNHCGISEWRGKSITLELEHRDGDHQNNVRENLECICPNCHSQTDTWRGRNRNGKRITDEDLLFALRQADSIYQALIDVGLSPRGNNYTRAKRLLADAR